MNACASGTHSGLQITRACTHHRLSAAIAPTVASEDGDCIATTRVLDGVAPRTVVLQVD